MLFRHLVSVTGATLCERGGPESAASLTGKCLHCKKLERGRCSLSLVPATPATFVHEAHQTAKRCCGSVLKGRKLALEAE